MVDIDWLSQLRMEVNRDFNFPVKILKRGRSSDELMAEARQARQQHENTSFNTHEPQKGFEIPAVQSA